MTSRSREDLPQTDEEIESAFDALGYGLTVDDLSFGDADEIEAFRQNHTRWNKPGRVTKNTADVLVIEAAQAVKGQRPRDVALVRFGEFCAIMGCDQ